MEKTYLNRFFTRSNIINPQINKDLVVHNYMLLKGYHRNEYFFKNTLFNKLVIGKYSFATTAAFEEVAIGKSKADFVLVNHSHGVVFEIKTDLDNLDRLYTQLEDYSTVFSELYVVTSEKNYYPVYRAIKNFETVGIIVLTNGVNLSIRKEAINFDEYLDFNYLFKLLRRNEYEDIIKRHFSVLPDVPPVYYYKECLNLFKKFNIKVAQNEVMKKLRERKKLNQVKLVRELPMEIRWLMYSSKLNRDELEIIIRQYK
ncbi:hypothetical protein JCM19037_2271 [Geomicrobium sp. JCM 19037]|uniref:sce7726 family protein n=1 Tax=Geomicrobium sp. JCM 19037 TaxID=1460634 RepID=UPI00045F218D|nr:sce7726 family protein [Geomicrobium sp. JCM 19037]GAK03910.1 hypothetical protein JCM19037_2271 [Geomicrobium sp. JCM 19037]